MKYICKLNYFGGKFIMARVRKPKQIKAGYAKAIHEIESPSFKKTANKFEEFTPSLEKNTDLLKNIFQNCSDVIFRQIRIHEEAKILLLYVDGLIDSKILDGIVLKPWMSGFIYEPKAGLRSLKEAISSQWIPVGKTNIVYCVQDAVTGILAGNVAIMIEDESCVLLLEIAKFDKRAIEEPAAEISVRGPRDGFTETLEINTSLLRRRLRSSRLKIESMTVGEISHTKLVITYIEGIAQDSILEEVRRRINRIQIDAVLSAEYLEEFIEDLPFTPFPQVQNTERPDVAVASLLEGKVAIFTDGTPFALIIPYTFWAGLQSADDYYERSIYSSSVRWLRYILFIIALLLPSVYVATTSFNPQLIPTDLLISIAAAREEIPFPIFVEALLMELMFEALREAGLRMPKPMGTAVSIVGALVIGQAAVQAGIVSAPIVIIVALTGIASLSIPRYNLGTAFRLLRFPMLILAGTIGFFGIALGVMAIIIHLVNLDSFGVPYFSPIAPQKPRELRDVLIRAPHWFLTFRPSMAGADKQRMPSRQKPASQPKHKE